MMLCLISIVVYGNADGEDRQWFSRYALRFTQGYSKTSLSRSSSSEAYREDRYKISASFMMLCLNSIVVYGNADGED